MNMFTLNDFQFQTVGEWIDKFLNYHCTGMDDHGNGIDDGCEKCDEMRRQLLVFVDQVAEE